MSRRTSEANKAIATAWSKEQALVREGKGTRDWTPEQQQDILNRGKAYDDNERAFEGHHMKSAEKFPEYQGDAENIQFLSRAEHFDAHNGNFQNPTNGYYNPSTGETKDFGLNKYDSCEIISLSEPLQSISTNPKTRQCNTQEADVQWQSGAPPTTNGIRGRLPESQTTDSLPQTSPTIRGQLPSQDGVNHASNTASGSKESEFNKPQETKNDAQDYLDSNIAPNEKTPQSLSITKSNGMKI